jgi:GxxExxY protein
MQMNTDEKKDETAVNSLTERILGCAFRVTNTLGAGFLEKVSENALAHELGKSGFIVSQQHPIKVIYDSVIVGEYAVDLLVENPVLVELETVRALDNNHSAQCLNYLRATFMRVCLLINFGNPRLEIKRVIHGY